MHMNSERDAELDRLRGLNARAVRGGVALVDRLAPGDLARPTPCAGWDLAALLGHLTAQHRGFAAAARGSGRELEHWAVRPPGEDVAAAADEYRRAAEDVIAAFAAVDDPDRPCTLPEFTGEQTFPAVRAIGFHLIDYAVHGWDLARTLELPYDPDPELLGAALPIARAVPDAGNRLADGAAFRPGLPVTGEAGELDQILAMLGRAPDWRAPAGSTPCGEGGTPGVW
ncbi:TIGR03086 family metal-binding protein [Streptomyces sp. NPDC090442]|uniref:TIGR03086 family metal-binding protein n=1 Tax=Streptomyces sp. NPDC090442 TaxID=3365962 RepID=UPI0038047B07